MPLPKNMDFQFILRFQKGPPFKKFAQLWNDESTINLIKLLINKISDQVIALLRQRQCTVKSQQIQ